MASIVLAVAGDDVFGFNYEEGLEGRPNELSAGHAVAYYAGRGFDGGGVGYAVTYANAAEYRVSVLGGRRWYGVVGGISGPGRPELAVVEGLCSFCVHIYENISRGQLQV